ncbi:hypothetical protein ACP6L2_00800 [Sphingobacterium lactis]|uniref:hypothetical protein n=1 Tax=Sphingobacterium lactis TaxID=797291 RepID=UPI003F7D6EE9
MSNIESDLDNISLGYKASTNYSSDPYEGLGTMTGNYQNEEFEVATFIKNPKKSTKTSSNIKAQNPDFVSEKESSFKASIPMKTGVKYRVYLRNRTTGHWQTKVFSSNSTSNQDTIGIYNYYSYDWYAFSNNTTSNNDVPDVLSGNSLEVMSENKDLLWAKGEILASTATTNQRLGITFQHKLARMQVNLDYRGLFINSMSNYDFNLALTGASPTFRKGILDLKTGNFVTGSHQNYAPSVTPNFPETGYADRQTYYFYSSEAKTFGTVKINYTSLNYTTYDGKNVVYDQSHNKSITLVGTGAGNIVTEIGGNTVLNFIFIESSVRSGNATTKWARANLYYEGDAARNPYRFHRQTTQAGNPPNDNFVVRSFKIANRDMFMKNHKKPDTYANRPEGDRTNTTLYPLGDPCSEVLPKGAWKKPSQNDFTNFVNTIPNMLGFYNNVNFKGITHLIGASNNTNVSFPYDSPYVIFERNGLINYDDLVVTTNDGYYWSDQNPADGQIGSLLKIVGVESVSITNPIWNVSVVNQDTHTAASIRCVRTNLYQ